MKASKNNKIAVFFCADLTGKWAGPVDTYQICIQLNENT